MAHGAKTEMNKTIKLWIEGRIWGRPNHLEPIQCSLQNDFQSLVRLNVISQHLAVDDCNVDTASPGAISKFQWVHYHLRFWEGGSELGHTCFKSPKPHKKKSLNPHQKKSTADMLPLQQNTRMASSGPRPFSPVAKLEVGLAHSPTMQSCASPEQALQGRRRRGEQPPPEAGETGVSTSNTWHDATNNIELCFFCVGLLRVKTCKDYKTSLTMTS